MGVRPGFEPGISRIPSENHTHRPIITKPNDLYYHNKDPDAVSPLMTPQVRIVDEQT